MLPEGASRTKGFLNAHHPKHGRSCRIAGEGQDRHGWLDGSSVGTGVEDYAVRPNRMFREMLLAVPAYRNTVTKTT